MAAEGNMDAREYATIRNSFPDKIECDLLMLFAVCDMPGVHIIDSGADPTEE